LSEAEVIKRDLRFGYTALSGQQTVITEASVKKTGRF
jgi:hypothetical protein